MAEDLSSVRRKNAKPINYLTATFSIEVSMNIHELNKIAWDKAVDEGKNPYTKIVSPEQIFDAKQGKW